MTFALVFEAISIKKCLHTVCVAPEMMSSSTDFSGDSLSLLREKSSAGLRSRRHGQSAFPTNDNEKRLLINGSTLAAFV